MEAMEAQLMAWQPFSSVLPFTYSTAAASYVSSSDEDMDEDEDIDPGVSETTFDWTLYMQIMPITPETVHRCFPGVLATITIPEGAYLGDFQAERKYIWEVAEECQENIIWVWEDCVLDCSNPATRNILTYVREGLHSNCRLIQMTDADGETHVGLEATHTIPEGAEIVYCHSEWI
jgi:hypothetical protein